MQLEAGGFGKEQEAEQPANSVGKWPPANGRRRDKWLAPRAGQMGSDSGLPTVVGHLPMAIRRRPFAGEAGRSLSIPSASPSAAPQKNPPIPNELQCASLSSRTRSDLTGLPRMSPRALVMRILVQTIYFHALALRAGKADFARPCFFLKKSKLPPTLGDARRIAVADKAESAVLRSSSSESGIG